jgi:hypothetical protein
MNFIEDEGKFWEFWCGVVVKKFPTARINYKNESVFMKILGLILFFNKEFMTGYTTVIGKTIYFPSRDWLERSYCRAGKIAAHEFVHMHEVNSFLYLFPQILALFSVFSLFSVVSSWFLFSLLFLVFLIPWPAYWRTRYELNGYAMNLFLLGLHIPEYDYKKDASSMSDQFVSSSYYYMSWNKNYIIRRLIHNYETLPITHTAFKEVHEWFKAHRFP